jgi:hypothetical protein
MGKRIVLNVVKAVAMIAAVVFWFCPLSTATQVLLFVGSIVVLLICVGFSSGLDDRNTGYWPPKPYESSLIQNRTETATSEVNKPRSPAD